MRTSSPNGLSFLDLHSPGMLLYALTIFISAFLLFQVQPMIGKFVLPWFGAAPGEELPQITAAQIESVSNELVTVAPE